MRYLQIMICISSRKNITCALHTKVNISDRMQGMPPQMSNLFMKRTRTIFFSLGTDMPVERILGIHYSCHVLN